MGVYFASPGVDDWRSQAEDDDDSLPARVEAALVAAHRPLGALGPQPYNFEEKFYRGGTGGFEALARSILGRDGFLGERAEVFVPLGFEGLLSGDGPGIYSEVLQIASSEELVH
jgi:hypothetical protein